MADDDETPTSPETPEAKPAPKRRRTRKKATEEPQASTAVPEPAVEPEAEAAEAAASAEDSAAPDANEFEEDPILALQRTLLDAALPHACIDGWTREMLAMAARPVSVARSARYSSWW